MAGLRDPKEVSEPPPLIEAKLAVPRSRASVVSRTRLFTELDRLGDRELTIVSGPAGSGKTVLVSSWLFGRASVSPAWVTLDPGDDDPVRLWTYVAHAAERNRNGLGRAALARLRTPRPSVETAIDELLNALSGYDGPIVVILDDLHHVRSERSLQLLVHAVTQLPEDVRLIAMTRSDPGAATEPLSCHGSTWRTASAGSCVHRSRGARSARTREGCGRLRGCRAACRADRRVASRRRPGRALVGGKRCA